jgi:hypothetical protein
MSEFGCKPNISCKQTQKEGGLSALDIHSKSIIMERYINVILSESYIFYNVKCYFLANTERLDNEHTTIVFFLLKYNLYIQSELLV